MEFKSATSLKAKIALFGHNGVNHAVSHSGFQQEDSMGFATLVNIITKAKEIDFTIQSVSFHENNISVKLTCGVEGKGTIARGATIFEKKIAQNAVGRSTCIPQTLTMEIFGRACGNGALEVSTAFNFALSQAIMRAIEKEYPYTIHGFDEVKESIGEFLAGYILIDEIPCAWLLTINSNAGGCGPNEDSEGNVPIGAKGRIMQELGMDKIPSIIIEARAFVPAIQNQVQENSFYVRWCDDVDNSVVGSSLVEALKDLQYPHIVNQNTYLRHDTSLMKEAERLANEIIRLGEEYKKAVTSHKRVSVAQALSKICTEDLGGSIFMSNKIFDIVAGGGLWPGTTAVLSSVVTKEYFQENNLIYADKEELEKACRVINLACHKIMENYDEAMDNLHKKCVHYSPECLLSYSNEDDFFS